MVARLQKGFVLKLLFWLVVAYFLAAAVIMLLMRSLMYWPDTNLPSAVQLASAGLRFWPAAESYRGFVSTQPPASPKATVVVFHGNAGAAWHRDYYTHALESRGYRVVLAEYPGFGGRPGKLHEKVIVADARQTLQAVYEQFGGPMIAWGESLGCGVAADIAADPPAPLSAVVMLTPWDSLESMAESMFSMVPLRGLVRGIYDNVANLRRYQGPVAVLIAEHDEVIPPALAERLYESLPPPKKRWLFAGAGHNTWPAASDEPWWDEVMHFVTNQK